MLLNLAEHEEQDSTRRMRGKERCALTTLLGWDSKEKTGKGMTGLLGFTRHQCLSVLISRHMRRGQNPLTVEEPREKPNPWRFSCGRPRWKTYWYYSTGRQCELSLGEAITNFSSIFSLACDEAGSSFKCRERYLKFTHEKRCIGVSFSGKDQESRVGGIVMWNSCAVCGAKSDSE